MNVGSSKYHPCGPTFTYKVGKVPCLVEFSEVGGISGHIITNVLRHFYYLKLYDNYRENSIISALLVDGHVSHFDLGFLKYLYMMKIKYGPFFCIPYGTSFLQVGTQFEC